MCACTLQFTPLNPSPPYSTRNLDISMLHGHFLIYSLPSVRTLPQANNGDDCYQARFTDMSTHTLHWVHHEHNFVGMHSKKCISFNNHIHNTRIQSSSNIMPHTVCVISMPVRCVHCEPGFRLSWESTMGTHRLHTSHSTFQNKKEVSIVTTNAKCSILKDMNNMID